MGDGAVEIAWHELRERLKCVQGEVIEEALVSLYVNGSELATIMCTPRDQADLALGFLKNEGFIQGLKDVAAIYVNIGVWRRGDIPESRGEQTGVQRGWYEDSRCPPACSLQPTSSTRQPLCSSPGSARGGTGGWGAAIGDGRGCREA